MVSYQLPSFLRSLYPFTPKRLKLSCGFEMSYIDEGEGQPILMVHGNPTWSFYYRNLVKKFSKKYRTIAIDHIGCGLSDKPKDFSYTLAAHVENLVEFVKHLELKNIILVVHDWGGAIGSGLAVQMPDNISKMVILNTAAFLSDSIPFRISVCRWPVIGDILVRHFNAFAFPATFMTTERPLSDDERAGYLYPYQTPAERIAISRFVQDIPMEESHPTYSVLKNIEEQLPLLKCPKLIIWGGKDFCFHRTFFDRWCSLFPQAQTHYFADAGHYVIEDKKVEGLELMERFFEQE